MRAIKDYLQLLASLLFLLAFGANPTLAAEQERILSFHSDITIAADGSMLVSETIKVVALGDKIRRGIYREFPTTYEDRYGNSVVVRFDVQSVSRDGNPEPWHTKNRSNGERIYVGDADVVLADGRYTYNITYLTDRQIGFFDDHDELYWNVTGLAWDFRIEKASATVTLPGDVAATEISVTGYTGRAGSTQRHFSAQVSQSHAAIETTEHLLARHGLTLAVGWPKGVIAPPTGVQRLGFLFSDNLGLLLAMLAFFGSGAYLLLMWNRYGRDPGAGVVFPHYEAPEGYSPASARFINRMGYDEHTFTAAVVNLAVKGHLSITEDDGDYVLRRTDSTAALAPGEEAMINKLFIGGTMLTLDKANHARVSAARTAHKNALKRDYLNKYFATNGRLMLPSIIASVVLIVIIVAAGLFVPLVFAFIAATVGLHILFAYLLKAPSFLGRQVMDKLEGFKMYLEVAEQDDLNLLYPPDKTPQLFEAYLPFAIALGVEQAWAEQFTAVFAQLEAGAGNAYQPLWYHGDFSSGNMNRFTSNVSDKLSSAISSAATPPGSSSGSGGGGFSGGGGGGGGGGGW